MTQAFSPEFAFAAACCAWPRTPARLEAIRRLAAAVRDWTLCQKLVSHHRIPGLVADGVAAAGAVVPPEVAAELNAARGAVARLGLFQSLECARLQMGFDAAGIPMRVLKGPALEWLAYGRLGLKRSRDIDLYVPEARVEDALTLASQLGYALIEPYASSSAAQRRFFIRHAREFTLIRRAGGGVIEIGWHLSDISGEPRGGDEFGEGQAVALRGAGTVRTLIDADLFRYLCQHGARHAWFRLKWLADLNAWLGRFDEAALRRFYLEAVSEGCGPCAAQALLLCQQIFALPLSEDFSSALSRPRRMRKLLETAYRAMGASDGSCRRWRETSLSPNRFRLCDGPAAFLRQLGAAALQPQDIFVVPLPPWLFFLYWPLRVPLFVFRRLQARWQAKG